MAQDYNARAGEAERGGSLGLAGRPVQLNQSPRLLKKPSSYPSPTHFLPPLRTDHFTYPGSHVGAVLPSFHCAKPVLSVSGAVCPPVTDNHVGNNPRRGFHGINSSLTSVKQKEVILDPEKAERQQTQAKVDPVLKDVRKLAPWAAFPLCKPVLCGNPEPLSSPRLTAPAKRISEGVRIGDNFFLG